MTVSTASVATERPGRYAKQLVSHLSRRITAEWDEASGTGRLDFGPAQGTLTAGDAALELWVEGDDVARLEDIVGRHLVRFGKKDELVVQWSRDDGTPGTSYRYDPDETPDEH
jgi:hypothetical protein